MAPKCQIRTQPVRLLFPGARLVGLGQLGRGAEVANETGDDRGGRRAGRVRLMRETEAAVECLVGLSGLVHRDGDGAGAVRSPQLDVAELQFRSPIRRNVLTALRALLIDSTELAA